MAQRGILAETVYNRITTIFQDASSSYPASSYFNVQPGYLEALTPVGNLVNARIRKGDGFAHEAEVELAIICTGPGQEITELTKGSKFAGFGFWNNDDLLMKSVMTEAGRRVLIVGGGDGGIGDFVRLITGKPDPLECLSDIRLPQGLINELYDLSCQMWSQYNASNRSMDHDLLTAIQQQLVSTINRAWETDPKLRKSTARIVLPVDARPCVQLLGTCYHFGLSYFCNRVLAQLIATVLADDLGKLNGGLVPFRVAARASNVQGLDGHSCSHDKIACSRMRHEVTFAPSGCGRGTRPPCPHYYEQCCARDIAGDLRGTMTDDITPTYYHRIIPRAGTTSASSNLPPEIIAAIIARRDDPIRDALSCHTKR